MLRRLSLVSALAFLACDTGQPGQVPVTAQGGAAGSGQGPGGNGGEPPGIDLGVAGIGGIGGGILAPGDDSDAGLGLGGGNANGGSTSSAAGAGAGGEAARFVEYIRSTSYSKLVFEIDSVEGQEPRSIIETRLPERFARILDKPGGIEVVLDDTLPANGDDFAWTDEDLAQVTSLGFDGDPDAETLSIHITYLDGHSAHDDESGVILGVAWGWLQIVMYKQTIENSCGGLGLLGGLREQACEEAELGILTHEVGHVLGLVDNGLPMVDDHRDPDAEHGAHDFDPSCIMYWAYEGDALSEQIASRLTAGNGDSLSFCQHCLDDLNAVK